MNHANPIASIALIAALAASSLVAGCRTVEQRQDVRTSRLESRQDRWDAMAEGSAERRKVRSDRMDERMDSRFDSW